ncbi:MAG: zinc ribbon domain-containing protein [Candidatus Aminicenantales bacterium]
MATSTAKTIGLILAVVLVLLAVGTTPLFLAPFGFFPGFYHLMRSMDISRISFWPYKFFTVTSLSVLYLGLFIIWIMVIVWVYRDAERRGMNGVLWALLVFIGNLIGLLIYLIVRTDSLPAPKSPPTVYSCSNCQEPVSSNFVFCPNCGTRLHPVCPQCHKPVEKNWQVCPHCGQKLS